MLEFVNSGLYFVQDENNFINPLLQVGSGEKSTGSRSGGPKINGAGSSSLIIFQHFQIVRFFLQFVTTCNLYMYNSSRINTYFSRIISSFSTSAITAQSTVLASAVIPISSSRRVLHHFFTRSSSPSLLLLVTLQPATYRYSISQQGRRTRVESEIPLQPRMSSSLSLLDAFRILSICVSSMPSKYPR